MSALIIKIALLLSFCSAGILYAEGLKGAPEFQSLEKAFPKTFSVAEGKVTAVEFCPDNTCYAFEAARGVVDEEFAGFIYLYLFYSSDYIYTETWQSNPENAAMAGRISAKIGPASCRSFSGSKAGLCVVNSFIAENKIKVSDVRYDENERVVTLVKKADISHTGLPASCRDFVEGFLSWYVPLALRNHKEPASVLAIRQRPAIFSDKIRKSLEEDRKAQERSEDIVGIDFDPFLSSQDPYAKYVVGKVTVEDGKCLADIRPGERRYWDLRAEAKQSDGAWRFTNFHYNSDVMPKDLLSILRDLKLARASR